MATEKEPRFQLCTGKDTMVVMQDKHPLFDVVVTPLHSHSQKVDLYDKAGTVVADLNQMLDLKREVAEYRLIKKRMGVSLTEYLKAVEEMVSVLCESKRYFNARAVHPECSLLDFKAEQSLTKYWKFIQSKKSAVVVSDPSESLGLRDEPFQKKDPSAV